MKMAVVYLEAIHDRNCKTRNKQTQKLSTSLCKEDKEFRHLAMAETSYTVLFFLLSDTVGLVYHKVS